MCKKSTSSNWTKNYELYVVPPENKAFSKCQIRYTGCHGNLILISIYIHKQCTTSFQSLYVTPIIQHKRQNPLKRHDACELFEKKGCVLKIFSLTPQQHFSDGERVVPTSQKYKNKHEIYYLFLTFFSGIWEMSTVNQVQCFFFQLLFLTSDTQQQRTTQDKLTFRITLLVAMVTSAW